jgi:hypothetical protein
MTLDDRLRRPLLRLLAVLVFAAQTAGLVHAADLSAHAPGEVCQVCQHQDRSGAAPPSIEPGAAPLLVEGHVAPRTTAPHAIAQPQLRPPSRAPPVLSTVR